MLQLSGLFLLVTALSADAFTAGVSYGTDHVRIPACSALVLSAVSSLLFLLSMAVGSWVSILLPGFLISMLSFATLFFLGVSRLSDYLIQQMIQKNKWKDRALRLSFHQIGFVFRIYLRPSRANIRQQEVLSPGEAFSLGLALSLDCIAAGISVAAPASLLLPSCFLAFVITLLALLSGSCLGCFLSGRCPLDLSAAGGLLLIVLAFGRLF